MKPPWPRKLVNRDPLNAAHRKQAFTIISALSKLHIRSATARELFQNGIMLTGVTISDEMNLGCIATHYHIEEGLMFPDNIIARCKDCRDAIQYRPHLVGMPKIICCFCAADNILTEYWESEESSGQSVGT